MKRCISNIFNFITKKKRKEESKFKAKPEIHLYIKSSLPFSNVHYHAQKPCNQRKLQLKCWNKSITRNKKKGKKKRKENSPIGHKLILSLRVTRAHIILEFYKLVSLKYKLQIAQASSILSSIFRISWCANRAKTTLWHYRCVYQLAKDLTSSIISSRLTKESWAWKRAKIGSTTYPRSSPITLSAGEKKKKSYFFFF